MDVSELEQKLRRKPLLSAENKDGSTRPGSREAAVSSRYKRTPSMPGARRSVSAERKGASSRTSSLTPPSTPVEDTEVSPALSKISGSKLPQEALWPPSTMRSLSVSFQSDTISIPTSKKEKPIPSRKSATPERKLRSSPSTENAKPADSFNSRLADRHRWPSRTSGIVPTSAGIDLSDKKMKASPSPSMRRLSLDVAGRTLEKSSSDLLLEMMTSHDVSPKISSTSGRAQSANRALPSPNPNLRSSSPSLTRRVSPVRPSRGPSPARARPSSPSRQPQSTTTTSVLSFTADIKKGQKAANHIDEAHQLRMLYNRHLQWRYANARADASLDSQKPKAEKTLYSVWKGTVDLRESARQKRALLQQLRIKSKLCSILNEQLPCLDSWSSIEMDYANSLNSALRDLQASTVRIPIVGGAKGNIESVKTAMSAAVDVMQTLGSSVCCLLAKVEGMSSLASELAAISAHERAIFAECESLLSSTNAMQVIEDSLRTHVIQSLEKW